MSWGGPGCVVGVWDVLVTQAVTAGDEEEEEEEKEGEEDDDDAAAAARQTLMCAEVD